MSLRVLELRDRRLSDTLSSFITRQQESLLVRRRESADGRVLLAIIQLHEEGVISTGAEIALRVNELDDEAEMTATRAGMIARRLGFTKKRLPGLDRHSVVWNEELAIRLALQYGIPLSGYLSPDNPSYPSQVSHLAS